MERLTMYSSGIAQRLSSKELTPSLSSKSESTMRSTWRATERPTSFLSSTPDCTSASPKRRLRPSSLMRADTRLNCSSVMRPSATSASPSRSFLRLLAAKTMRPWSRNTVLTIRPDCTCRSPLCRSTESLRSVSLMGVTARSVSMGSPDTTPGEDRQPPERARSLAGVDAQLRDTPAVGPGPRDQETEGPRRHRGCEQEDLAVALAFHALIVERGPPRPHLRLPEFAAVGGDEQLQFARAEAAVAVDVQLDAVEPRRLRQRHLQPVPRTLHALGAPPGVVAAVDRLRQLGEVLRGGEPCRLEMHPAARRVQCRGDTPYGQPRAVPWIDRLGLAHLLEAEPVNPWNGPRL